jgi:hypothetical protein
VAGGRRSPEDAPDDRASASRARPDYWPDWDFPGKTPSAPAPVGTKP